MPAFNDPSFNKRCISALILGPVAVAAVYVGGLAFDLMVMVVASMTAWEYAHMRKDRERARRTGLAIIACVAVVIVCEILHWHLLAILVIASASAACAFGGKRIGVLTVRGATGMAYIGLPVLALMWLRAQPEGLLSIISLLLLVWMTDTMAYVAGRKIGGAKLAPRISPGKTWAGLLGGMVGAGLLAVGFTVFWGEGIGLIIALALGACVAVVAQMGDLFESYMKRRAEMKDSSRVIPGHGGLLDRIDGLLFAAPTFALLCLMFGTGAVPWL